MFGRRIKIAGRGLKKRGKKMNTKGIATLLNHMGGSRAYLGFRYAVNCVDLILQNEELQYYVTEPYVDTATKYHTTVGCVERNVRTLIKHIWEEGDREVLNQVASVNLKTCPKNKAFFAMVAVYFRERVDPSTYIND